jgi:esterase/lipase
MKTKTIKCNFKNSRGNSLDARLDVPAHIDISEITNFIIFCHCFTCTKETITTFRLSRLLAENGNAVLRFDFTGLGNSEGDFSATTFTSTQDDLKSAINFLNTNYRSPSFLMGHSLGGTTALSVAEDYVFVKGVVTVASPSEPEHVLHHFGHALTLLEQNIAASFEVAGQYYEIEPEFVEDVRSVDMRLLLSKLEKPVLVVNVENDALVKQADSQQILDWVDGETTLINVTGSNHLLSNREATEMVAGDIVQWILGVG